MWAWFCFGLRYIASSKVNLFVSKGYLLTEVMVSCVCGYVYRSEATRTILNLIRPRSPVVDCNHWLVVTLSSCLSQSVSLRRSCGVTEVIEQLINPTPTAHTLLQSSGPGYTHTETHTHIL